MALAKRQSTWSDRRRAPPKSDDSVLLADIGAVIEDLGTYGYRRVWGVLRHQGVDDRVHRVSPKRVCRVMRDQNHRSRWSGIHNEGTVVVDHSNIRWCSEGLEIGCDNGSCYIASNTCSFTRALGLKPITTPVQSPQSNGMAESFVTTFRRDYIRLPNRPDSLTVMNGLKTWFEHYNQKQPHSALKYLSLRMFRQQ